MKEFIESLKDGKYNVEDLKFLNMEEQKIYKPNPCNTKGLKIFAIENEMTLADKIKVIDIFKDNIATYLLNIINKWDEEKGSLPKDKWDAPKTVSVKAWIKRNDPRGKIDNDYKIGRYHLFGEEFKSLDTKCPSTEYNYSMEYTGENVVNQWFHNLCDEFKMKESDWFKEHDPKQIKITKLKHLGDSYRIGFKCKLLNDIVYNRETNVTDEQLDLLISAYEVLEKCIAEQTGKISKVLGKENMYED